MAELKVEPANATFTAPFAASRCTQTLTNGGSSRITWKIKCTHPDQILVNPVFGVVEGGQSAKVNLHGRFKEGPDAKASYRVYIQYAEATTDMAPTDDQQKLRQAWAAIKTPKTYKVTVAFQPPLGEAPPPAAAADAPPAEVPAAEPPPAEAPPAEAAPAE